MTEDPLYQPGQRASPWGSGREGGRCGCIAGLLFAASVYPLILFATVVGDCVGDRACHQGDDVRLAISFAIVLALAASFGLAVRTLVRWWRLRGTEAAPGPWALVWSMPIAFLLALLAIRCALILSQF